MHNLYFLFICTIFLLNVPFSVLMFILLFFYFFHIYLLVTRSLLFLSRLFMLLLIFAFFPGSSSLRYNIVLPFLSLRVYSRLFFASVAGSYIWSRYFCSIFLLLTFALSIDLHPSVAIHSCFISFSQFLFLIFPAPSFVFLLQSPLVLP